MICGERVYDGSEHVCQKKAGHSDHHEFGPEMVDHPNHYGGEDNPYEHQKVMHAIGMDHDAYLYQCTKYLWRMGKKTGAPNAQDLRKALWYLQKRIELEEEGTF